MLKLNHELILSIYKNPLRVFRLPDAEDMQGKVKLCSWFSFTPHVHLDARYVFEDIDTIIKAFQDLLTSSNLTTEDNTIRIGFMHTDGNPYVKRNTVIKVTRDEDGHVTGFTITYAEVVGSTIETAVDEGVLRGMLQRVREGRIPEELTRGLTTKSARAVIKNTVDEDAPKEIEMSAHEEPIQSPESSSRWFSLQPSRDLPCNLI